jgi:hypothetical protein
VDRISDFPNVSFAVQKLRFEIKAHIRNVQNDTGKLATLVAKERELSTKHIADLSKTIAIFRNTPMSIHPKDDPYCQNQLVMRQLQKQVSHELPMIQCPPLLT